MTVRELGRRMDSRELSEWLAYDCEYGLGDNLDVTGMVCATVARSMGGGKAAPSDFVPYFRAEKIRRRQSTDEMLATMTGFADRHNRGVGSDAG
jgi:hypothetical protein